MERENIGGKRREKRGEEREEGGWRFAGALQPVCFRLVLKDYPFISTYILVSVGTRREASRGLSCRDLQRIMRRPNVPGPKCLSGLTDNAFRDLCLRRDVSRPVYSNSCQRRDCSKNSTLCRMSDFR